MPTLRGWCVAGLGFGLVGAGAAFGAPPIQQLGLALLALAILAVVVVRMGRHDLEIDRSVSPARAGAGQSVTVDVTVTNKGRGAAPLLLLEDRLPRGAEGSARFSLHGVEAGGRRHTSYQIKVRRRGSYDVGPLEVSFVDPFGLARVSATAAMRTQFLVYPGVEHLTLPRDLGRNRSHALSAVRQPTGVRGDDFYALREYVPGDDLRRVHWPSTGKRGRLMIRQEEIPWQTRVTILVDDRADGHEGAGETSSFERVVEAAASLADLYQRSGYSYRLLGSGVQRLANGRGGPHLMRALDALATWALEHDRSTEVDPLLARLSELESGRSSEGTLALVAGHLTADIAAAVVRARRRFRDVIVIGFPAHRFGEASTKVRWRGESENVEVVALLMRSGVHVMTLGPEDSLMSAWGSFASTRVKGGDAAWAPRPEPA